MFKVNTIKSEISKIDAQIEQLKRDKEEMESAIMAKAQFALNEQLKIEKEKIQKTVDDQNELKLKQKEEQLEQLKKQLQDTQRKLEQGSQQLQGEVQELAIEEYLQNKYPFDFIEERISSSSLILF